MFERKDYISWDDFFMLQAKLITLRNVEDSTGIGLVVADNNKRVILHSNQKISDILNNEDVLKAIPENSTLYITDFPSIEDAQIITTSKIKNVVYSKMNEENISSIATVNFLFSLYKINCRQYQIKHNIVIPKDGAAYIDYTDKSTEILDKESTSIDNWDDYWVAQSKLVAQRSKDPATQVGSVIISEDNDVLSLGYNGAPNGFDDELLPWSKTGDDETNKKFAYVCHSELNAVINYYNTKMFNSDKPLKSSSLNPTIYVTLFPCNECAKLICQSGIKNIVYAHIKNEDRSDVIVSKKIFDTVGITYTHHKLSHDIIIQSDVLQLQMKPKSRTLEPENNK